MLKCFCCCSLIAALLSGEAMGRDAITPRDLSNVFGVAHVDGKYYLTSEDFLDEGADTETLSVE